MLKTRFWRHLFSEELKNATRMYFETAKIFDELRGKVRTKEYEMKTTGEFGKSIETNRKNKVDIKKEMKVEVKQQT